MREFLSGGMAGAVLAAGLMGALHLQGGAGATTRMPQFENETVKAWKTVVAPHTETTLHRHDHSRVVVALTNGRLDSVDAKGVTTENPWEAGHAYWLPAMPPGAMHKDVNPGDKPMEVVVLELLSK
jgi:hypothetical protein